LRIPPWSVAALVLVVVAASVTRNLIAAAHQPIAWALASISLAVLLAPVVVVLDRFVHRALAIFVTLIVLAAAIVTLVLSMLSAVRDEVDDVKEQLPAAAADVEDDRRFGEAARDFGLRARVDSIVESVDARLSGRVAVERAVGTVPTFLVNAILTVFFLIWGPRIWHGGLAQIGDVELRQRVADNAHEILGRSRRYVHLVALQAIAVGLLVALIARLVGLPAAPVLGLIAGVLSLMPYIGIVFGGLPLVLLTAAVEPLRVTLAVAAAVVLLQAAALLSSRNLIHPRSVRVGPAPIVILSLIGLDAYGLGGAIFGGLIAVVLVATVDVLGRDEGADADETLAA
jgi:predicted PurR-regulated permease PerM